MFTDLFTIAAFGGSYGGEFSGFGLGIRVYRGLIDPKRETSAELGRPKVPVQRHCAAI